MSNLSQFLGGSLPKAQAFTSNGTFTKPTNVGWATALLVGGGGGGTPAAGGGGGETKLIPLYLTSCSTITIGTGGTATPTVTSGGNTTATGSTPVTATAYGGQSSPAGGRGGGAGGGGGTSTGGALVLGTVQNSTTAYGVYANTSWTKAYPFGSPQMQNGSGGAFGMGGGGGAWSTAPYLYGQYCGGGCIITQYTTTSFLAGNSLGLGSPTGGGRKFRLRRFNCKYWWWW